MLLAALVSTATACAARHRGPSGPVPEHQPGGVGRPAEPNPRSWGMVRVLLESLREVPVREEQRPGVDAVFRDLHSAGAPARSAAGQLADDLAAGIAAGRIDRGKVDPDVDALGRAVADASAAVQGVFDRLHGILDASQRKRLVEAMRARSEARGPGEPSGHGGGAGDEGAPRPRMHALVEQLALTPGQRDQIRDQIRDAMRADRGARHDRRVAMREHARAVGDAFEQDAFDAKAAGVGRFAGELAHDAASDGVRLLEIVTGVLEPEQRARLAEIVRQRASQETAGDD